MTITRLSTSGCKHCTILQPWHRPAILNNIKVDKNKKLRLGLAISMIRLDPIGYPSKLTADHVRSTELLMLEAEIVCTQ